MADILRPLKKKIKKHKIASFDVETYSDNNICYLIGLYYDNKYIPFYDVDKFYNYIETYLSGYWIVATNLSFDLTAAFLNSRFWGEFKIIQNGGFMLMAFNKNLNVTFVDTLNWHKASVKDLGIILNLEKDDHPLFLGKKPKTPFEEYELRQYNKRDCEISCKFTLWFQDQVNKLGGELRTTIASTSMDIFRRKFLKQIIFKEAFTLKDDKIKNKIFKAYYGGRTECIKRGEFENLEYYDFNSLYPSVMIEELPNPNFVRHIKDGSLKDIMTKEGVSCVQVKYDGLDLPLLPFRGERLLFPTGCFKGWFSHIELRTALENGYEILKVYETVSYSKTFKPFEDFVNTMYALRQEFKRNKNSAQLIIKLIMNSLYGKFGERTHKCEKHINLLEDFVCPENINLTINDDGNAYYTWEEECNSSHVFPIWAIYITSLARIKLWKLAKELNPVYMDTDSVITNRKLPFSKKLGDIDHEYSIKRAIFIKPKMYYMETHEGKEIVRMKGIPRASKLDFFKSLNHESICYTKFVKLKEGIRRNLIVNSKIEMLKNLDLEDIKRDWGGKEFTLIMQESRAVVINDGYEQGKELLQQISITNIGKAKSKM